MLRENELLSRYSTFGIGGPARWFREVRSSEEMISTIRWAVEQGVPYRIIGNGSNTLFDDRGYAGLILLNRIDGIRLEDEFEDGVRVRVGSGASFAALGVRLSKEGWTGLEFACGIPGTVGGAVVMNAGANGQETADVLDTVEVVNARSELVAHQRGDLAFGYRSSPFQGGEQAVVGAVFLLRRCERARDHQRELLAYRKATQPYGKRSAGCVFRNPSEKLAAGALVDKCGLKGISVGGASISELHANFIVNSGGASARDVQTLVDLVKRRVRDRTGIELSEEMRFIPYE